jgi:hypothetical protein
MAVWGRARDGLRPNDSIGTHSILDDERLPERIAQPTSNQPGSCVAGTPGRVWKNDPDRLVGPISGSSRSNESDERSDCGKWSAGKHRASP